MKQVEAMLRSLALETPIVVCVACLYARSGGARRLVLAGVVAVLATCITHPLFWHFNLTLAALPPWPRLLCLELVVVVVEAAVLLWVARLPAKWALLASAASNATSFGVGLALRAAGIVTDAS